MSKPRLSDTLLNRSPLTKREAVTPVNMYTNPPVDKPTTPPTGKPASPQTDSSTTPLVDQQTSGQPDTPATPHSSEPARGHVHNPTTPPVEKYTTHLRHATIKAIKQAALDQDCKDYEIVQHALDVFLASTAE